MTDADCTSISDRYNCFNSFCACEAPSLAPPRMIGASIVARFSTRVAPTEMAPPKSGFVDREPSAYKSATAADVAKSERERRPSLDDEEEAAMEAKYEAFKAAKEAAEKEAALRGSRAP